MEYLKGGNMDITGYIEYDGNDYTFTYKNNFLTLIICDQSKDKDIESFVFRKKEKVLFFNGFTSDGFDISFYIDEYVSKWKGTYRCFPKLIFVALNKETDLKKAKFNSIKFIGGVIDRFYSNRRIVESDLLEFRNTKELKFKKAEDTVEEENIMINNKSAVFQISVSNMGWRDDGSIHFDDIHSVIRLKYKKKQEFGGFVDSILTINDMLFFCLNRRYAKYDNIYLETKTEDNTKYINSVSIYMPTKEQDFTQKNMLQYQHISKKINKLIRVLTNMKYSTYRIPKDEEEYSNISASMYTSAFSAYQSIYNYIHQKNGIVHDYKGFEELKNEICELLDSVSEKYKGVDSKKRKFAESFSNLVKKSNLKLEDMIISGAEEFPFIINTLPDKKYKEILSDLKGSIIEAVDDRDSITHNDVFAPTDTDMAVYLMLERITYSMILKKIGLKKKMLEDIVKHLSILRII